MHKKFGQPKKGTTKMCFTTVFVEKNQSNSYNRYEDFLNYIFDPIRFSHSLSSCVIWGKTFVIIS